MKRGKLIVFCGPSGSGKGTVEKGFINDKKYDFHFSVSSTTRKKRDGEVDSINYNFLTKEEFKLKIENNEFLEWAEYIDNFYGTPIAAIEDMLVNGKNVFLEIEVIGVKQVIAKMPEAITIFLSPPSIEELEKRLKNRGSETKDVISQRVARAKEEINYANDKTIFKYNVINKDIDKTIKEIKDIINKEIYA